MSTRSFVLVVIAVAAIAIAILAMHGHGGARLMNWTATMHGHR
jgi:hypothetical protein